MRAWRIVLNLAAAVLVALVLCSDRASGKLDPELVARNRKEYALVAAVDVIKMADVDGDGRMSLQECAEFHSKKYGAVILAEDLRIYDLDGDGFFSEAEVEAYKQGSN